MKNSLSAETKDYIDHERLNSLLDFVLKSCKRDKIHKGFIKEGFIDLINGHGYKCDNEIFVISMACDLPIEDEKIMERHLNYIRNSLLSLYLKHPFPYFNGLFKTGKPKYYDNGFCAGFACLTDLFCKTNGEVSEYAGVGCERTITYWKAHKSAVDDEDNLLRLLRVCALTGVNAENTVKLLSEIRPMESNVIKDIKECFNSSDIFQKRAELLEHAGYKAPEKENT